MLENITDAVNRWDWKIQRYNWMSIPQVIAGIESWTYRSKKIKLNIEHYDITRYQVSTIKDYFDLAVHYKLIENANLEYPIILSNKWVVVDWRHRLIKAILKGHKEIDAIMIMDQINAIEEQEE